MPDRAESSEGYRYGFNGKEKDDDVKGSGVQYDYGFRIYDARIARFLSVDPLTKQFPFYTPYQFAGNKPIVAIDLDGLEESTYTNHINRTFSNPVTAAKFHEEAEPLAPYAAVVTGGMAIVSTGGLILEVPGVAPVFWRVAFWLGNPVNQETAVGVAGLAASIFDPDPSHDYPGNFDDVARGAKLILGKSHIIKNYAKDVDNAYHMFKDGFGLGIPKFIPPSSQIMKAMYDTVEQGGTIIIDLEDVSIELAKKGFKSFDEAAEISVDGFSKITEWELSQILRDKDLFENTLFKVGDEIKDASAAGLKLIDE